MVIDRLIFLNSYDLVKLKIQILFNYQKLSRNAFDQYLNE